MKLLKASSVGGTVQEVNSLRGACLAQGLMAARLLRQRLPGIRLTESHPKGLLWLLGLATLKRRVAAVKMKDLRGFITCDEILKDDHQRDAALGAVAAWNMISKGKGWRNLRLDEASDVYEPELSVEYWMPIAV